MTISSWLNFGSPAPPGRGSAAGRNFLAPHYYGQRAVFASHRQVVLYCLYCKLLYPLSLRYIYQLNLPWHDMYRVSAENAVKQQPTYRQNFLSKIFMTDLPRWLSWLRHSAHRLGQSVGGAGVQFSGLAGRFRVRISGAHALRLISRAG